MALAVTAYVGRLGLNVYWFAVDGTTNALRQITAVGGNPTCTVNGSSVALQGPWWSDGIAGGANEEGLPFVAYTLATPALATDVVEYSASSGWFTASGSAPAATNAAVANYVGQFEPGIGNFAIVTGVPVNVPGFGVNDMVPTMPVGFNSSWSGSALYFGTYNWQQNWFKKCSKGTNLGSPLDTHGHPLTITAASVWKPIQVQQANLVDNRLTPIPLGVWTFVADETLPGSPMTVTIACSSPGHIASSGTTPGTLVNGVRVGKTWWFDLELVASPSNWGPEPTITFGGAGGTYPANWTLQNERLIPPLVTSAAGGNAAQTYVDGEPYQAVGGATVDGKFAIDQNLIHNLTTPSGKGPATIRFMDAMMSFDGRTGESDASTLQSPYNIQWQGTEHQFTLSQIRPYDPAVSPYVYFPQAYPGTSNIGDGTTPYAIAIAGVGDGTVGWLNFGGSTTGWLVAEFVTTGSHGLVSGQNITLPSGGGLSSVTQTAGSSSTTTFSASAGSQPIWVTSATTFVMTLFGNSTVTTGMPGLINNISGTQTVTGNGYVFIPDNGSLAAQVLARAASQWTGCRAWWNIPGPAMDNLITSLAQTALAYTDPGHEHIIELENEVWSNDFAKIIAYANGKLGLLGTQSGHYNDWLVGQSARAYWLWRAVFDAAGRGNEVKLCVGGQFTDSAVTQSVASSVATYNAANPSQPCVWDYHCIADYIYSETGTTFKNAAALVYKSDSRSIGFGSGNNAWTVAQWLELLRHNIKYDTFQINGNWLTQILGWLDGYTAVGPQPFGYVPQLVGYEGSIQNLFPHVDNTGSYTLQGDGTHDCAYHPDVLHAMRTFYQRQQYIGLKFLNVCAYNMVRWNLSGTNGTQPALAWGQWNWAAQDFGYGDGSDGKATNQFSAGTGTSYDNVNVSVLGQAYQNWAEAANVPAATTRKPGLMRWFPQLRASARLARAV